MAEITQARDIPPLPLDLVNAVIQEIQKNRPLFLYSYPLNDVSLVVRLYQSAFTGSTPVSSAHLACTYGTLYFILREFKYLQNPICQKLDFNESFSLAEKKFDALLKDYRVLNVPSFGNVLALTLGAMKAQNLGNPFLNCTLISAAASHCQSLGYNHDSSHGNSSNSRRLFWCVYMLEKEVSIFFGRASALQDADIDVAPPVFSHKGPVERWDQLFEAGIKLAKIQRRICNDLYSRKSLKLGQTERENKIHDTVQKDHHFYDNRMYYTLTLSDGTERLFRLAEDMLETKRSATLTTLLRAPSSLKTGQTHIRPECFKAARSTLKLYLHCSRACELGGLSSETERYRDWGLLSCIITPFIVITLHAIASSSTEDIALLNNVVSTLEQIQAVSPSESCEKLYKFTSSFAKAATGFFQRRESIHSVSRWRYSQQDDSLSLASREKEPSTTESLPKGRPGSSATLASASSVFTRNTDEGSLFQQVIDEDMREVTGEGAEELFRVLEGCMGGGLVSVLDVFGGGFLDA